MISFPDVLDFDSIGNLQLEKYVSLYSKTKNWELVVDEVKINNVPLDIYRWPMVTNEFCKDIIKDAELFGDWTSNRHDHYPTHDILLEKFGYNDVYNLILDNYLHTVARYIWGLEGDPWLRMETESFIVKYDNGSAGNMNNLAIHSDGCEYSCILSLNEDYEGGGTWFPKQNTLIKNNTGTVSLFPQMVTHRHGARPVESGVRYIITTFCYRECGRRRHRKN